MIPFLHHYVSKRANSVTSPSEAIQTIKYRTVLMAKMPMKGKIIQQEHCVNKNKTEYGITRAATDEDRGLCIYTMVSQKKAPSGEPVALLLFLVTCLRYEIGFDMTKWIAQAVCNEIQILLS